MTQGEQKAKQQPPEREAPLKAKQLFDGRREREIEFRGEIYRLRITRNEKLILTK